QVPNGKSFVAGQHGGNAVALHVFLGGAALVVNHLHAEKLCDVMAAERLGAGGFLQDVVDQYVGLFVQHLQLDGFQGNRLPALRIGGLIDRANLGMRDLAEYFETSNLICHCSLSPEKNCQQAVFWKDARLRPWGKARLEYRGWIGDGSYEGKPPLDCLRGHSEDRSLLHYFNLTAAKGIAAANLRPCPFYRSCRTLLVVVFVFVNAVADAVLAPIQLALFRFGQMAVVLRHVR